MSILTSLRSVNRSYIYAAGWGALCAIVLGFFLYIITPPPLLIPCTRFHVMVPSYNNELWCVDNLKSIVAQEYPHELWHVTILTDACTDATYELLCAYVEEHNLEDLVTVLKNDINRGSLGNIYQGVMMTPDHEVVVLLDGDDFFAHPQVLQELDQVYQQADVWITYGQYRRWPQGIIGICEQLPEWVIAHNEFRQAPFVMSHVKTFYAWLFKLIRLDDMLINGSFCDVCGDFIFMLAMMEMAGERHRFLERVSCIYNCNNPINDYRVRVQRMQTITDYVRSQPPYQRLSSKPLFVSPLS